MNDSAPGKPVWDSLKTFAPATWTGLALLVLFAVFTQIETCVVRWWLMLPLAAVGGGILAVRRRSAAGLEARICTGAFWLFLALVVLRDIGLSRKLAELFDKMKEVSSQFREFNTELDRFFR